MTVQVLKTRLLPNGHGSIDLLDSRTKKVITTATTPELAEWAQLRHELGLHRATQLQRLATNHPQLTTRIKRAGLMFARRLCGPVDWDNADVYKVRSQTQSNKEYQAFIPKHDLAAWSCHVTTDPMAPSPEQHCCPDIANNAPAIEGQGKRCKHMLLAALHRAWVWQPWAKEQDVERQRREKATSAQYGDGHQVTPEDLAAFANFIRNHRRLPLNPAALS